jgi:hypothetical protein
MESVLIPSHNAIPRLQLSVSWARSEAFGDILWTKERVGLGKTGILLLLALIGANAQCFAACSLFSCTNATQRQQPVSSNSESGCHHKSPPSDAGQSKTPCAHQPLLSEAGSQFTAPVLDGGVLVAVDSPAAISGPDSLPRLQPSGDPSPPPLPDLASKTILRI